LYKISVSRDRIFPADNIGFWWLIFLNLYTSVPAVAWWLKGGQYHPVFSQRLIRLHPSQEDVFSLLIMTASYAVSFTVIYWLLQRKATSIQNIRLLKISNGKFIAAGLIVILAAGVGLTQSLSLPDTTYYGERFQQISSLPLGTRQLLKLIAGFGSVAGIVFITGIFQRWPRYRPLIYIFVLMTMVTFISTGSRGQFFGGVFMLAILWHILKRPLSSRYWLLAGVGGVVLFLFLGILRGLIDQDISYLAFFGRGLGEFDHLWANSVEVYQAAMQGSVNVSLSTRFGEFWAFIPSQLLSIEKQTLSDWFLDAFYPEYKALGGGWAFGALAQVGVGGGAFEASIRGAALGCIFGMAYLAYRNSTSSWWVFPSYMFLLVFSFNSIRNTTFWFLTGVIQTLIPALIVIAILGALLSVKQYQLQIYQQR
jgi:hypothetical protein